MAEEEKDYAALKQLLEKEQEALLSALKEKARYIEIENRKKFETQLLQLAQEIVDYNKRNSIYETLVSLQTIWNQNLPTKGLQEKFKAAFDEGNYKEAEVCYKRLAKQGIDYIGTFQTGTGEIIPLEIEENPMLLHYNKKQLTFYSLQLEPLEKISLPEPLSIIHIHVPIVQQTTEFKSKEKLKLNVPIRKMFILLEGQGVQKAVIEIELSSINSIKSGLNEFEKHMDYLDSTLANVQFLSFFQEHLLLISKKAIYYSVEKGKWTEWYTTHNDITAFKPTRMAFWVGHANGDVFILKNLQYVGNRHVFREFSEPVTGISGNERYVLISNKNCLRITDHSSKRILEPFESPCEITHSAIMKNEFFLILAANGILTARELTQGNIVWEMNLGKSNEMLFAFRQYVFCGKSDGEIMMFEVPAFQDMAKKLEHENIHVEKIATDMEPTAPVRYISDFIGRQDILDEIKEMANVHFFLYGEPRVGKTSLLNILKDTLSEKARCCIIDMSQLLQDAETYKKFQLKFMEKCLGQHFLKLTEMPGDEVLDFQVLRSFVDKIRRTKDFCVFCLDNFFIPLHFDRHDIERFRSFLSSMFLISEARLIITYGHIHKSAIKKFFDDFKSVFDKRKVLYRHIPFFSELEVKNALRAKITFQQPVVNEIYQYTGKFPHLIHLYDLWEPGRCSIEEESNLIARHSCDKIFEYFRDLSLNARLLIATCLDENLVGEKISYETFYDKFPFLKSSLPKDQLTNAIDEIEHYSSGAAAKAEKEWFQITLCENAQLFNKASKHISWMNDFKTLYKFSSVPDREKALKVTQIFTRITQGALEGNEYLEQKTKKYKDKFYIAKLNEQGMKALKMPLATYIIVPLTRWRKQSYREGFQDLCFDFQEVNRKARELKVFYTIILELHGTVKEEVKKDLEGV
ncbi:MAG: ATP-binding protein, partial [Acidobacteria bacterium]|nr:ATP-binding protein [Acidobacteriota bacterium]